MSRPSQLNRSNLPRTSQVKGYIFDIDLLSRYIQQTFKNVSRSFFHHLNLAHY